jgi:hypothetical protein
MPAPPAGVYNMSTEPQIRIAHSCAPDPREAVEKLHAALTQPDMALVIFFCSGEYDLDALAREMDRRFAGVPVVGCTTAGEIGPGGYCDRSISGASFPAAACTAVTGHLDRLQQFAVSGGQTFIEPLQQALAARAPAANARNSFAFLLIDGLSVREEPVTRALQHALGDVPLLGGSAGDGLRFANTYVYHDGRFHPDSAVIALVSTSLPFRTFMTQHFVSGDERLVVTEADIARRIVKEINGLPAAREYARAVGVDVGDLDPMRFAAWPVVVRIGGADYVRSIQKANPDGSLTFFCAIEEGLVFRVAHGMDLVQNLDRTFENIRAEIGPPQLVLTCDCILRNLEIRQCGIEDRVEAIFRRNNAVGFSTYGEQCHGMHVNQTLTGIAIGSSGGTHG